MAPLQLDGITDLLTKYLDVQSRRAQVISGNIANADTQDYVAQDLKFDEYLRDAARQALKPRGLNSEVNKSGILAAPRLVEQTPNSVSIDGNTVDIGHEMTSLAETGMQFLEGTKLLQSRIRTLRTAIREGR